MELGLASEAQVPGVGTVEASAARPDVPGGTCLYIAALRR